MAEVSDVGEENIAGGIAMMERYARLAVCRGRGLTLAPEIAVGRKKAWPRKKRGLTDCSVCKNDEKASVIYPLDFKASICILPLRKSELNIARLELLRKTS
jgi:hypothetical protein